MGLLDVLRGRRQVVLNDGQLKSLQELRDLNEKPSRRALEKQFGATGTTIYSGFISNEEYNLDLQGLNGIALYDRMFRSDGQIGAILRACSLPILQTSWKIDAASESPLDQEVARFVQDNLIAGGLIGQTWHEVLEFALTCFRYGFSVMEAVYTLSPDGYIRIHHFGPRLARTIYRWHIDDQDQLIAIEQRAHKVPDGESSSSTEYKIVTIPAFKLLIFTLQREGNNFEGVSLLRQAYKHWYYKEQTYQIDAIANERHSLGIPVFSEPPGATDADRLRAEQVAQSLAAHERNYIIEPDGWSFRLQDMGSGSLKDPMPTIEHHDKLIARSVLAQFLNMNDNGSYARSVNETSLFLSSLENIAKMIVEVFNSVIRRLVDLNFNVEAYPTLSHGQIDRRSMFELLELLPTLSQAQLITATPDIEDRVRLLLDLPPKPEGREGESETSGGDDAEETPGPGADDEDELDEPVGFDGSRLLHYGGGHSQSSHGRGKSVAKFDIDEMSGESAEAISFYTGDGYARINGRLRDGGDLGQDKYYVRGLDAAMSESVLVEDIVVYRSIEPGKMPQGFRDMAYTSTTKDYRVAEDLGGEIVGIRLKKGQNALDLESIQQELVNGGFPIDPDKIIEREVLLPRGTTFKQVGRGDGQDTHIMMYEISE